MKWDERKDRLRILVFKVIINMLAAMGAYRIIVRICMWFSTEFSDQGHVRLTDANRRCPDNRITVLVTDFVRFRGDIDVLTQAKDIRIICISWSFLRYLLASYVHQPTIKEETSLPKGTSTRLEFGLAREGTDIYSDRQRYRKFLQKLLPLFFEAVGIDVVMNSDLRFRRETDLTWVASELGYPHICYFREALYIVPAIYDKAVTRYRKLAPFHGDVIAVQNEITGQIFPDSGMADKNKIMVRGCPRMDSFFTQLSNLPVSDKKRERRQIAFFSWSPHVPLQDKTKFDLFLTALTVVRALAEMAKDDPSLKVVLKIKDQHMKGRSKGQISGFQEVLRNVSGNEKGLPNVEFVTDRMGAQDVIMQSDVICAMQTTVVLESALAGKPIILPHFEALIATPKSEQALMFGEYRHLFDLPKDSNDLKRMLIERLENPKIASEIAKERTALFERFVSPASNTAAETMFDLIRTFGQSGRKKRAVDNDPASKI